MIPVAGGEVWAEDTGGDGQPVVLLHPGWGDSTIWGPSLSKLAEDPDLRVIRYDTRGYGRSPAPAVPYTQLGDLMAVIDHLRVRQALLVGHSSGGGTAVGLALASQQHVKGLVLIAPGIQDYPWPADDPYTAEFNRLFALGDREALAALGLRTWVAAGTDSAARAQIQAAVAAFFRQGENELPDPPAYPSLGDLRLPSVLLIGDRDYTMVQECADKITERIPRSRKIVVPGADHLLPLRAPALLADVITEYAQPRGV